VGFSEPVRKLMFGWQVVFYDLGGGSRIRGVWPQYFSDVHGVVFVVDSSDRARAAEAAKELHEALAHPMVVGKPVLMCVRPPARALGQPSPTHSQAPF
jgi:ADP-ribosylation factor-like protein 13B